MEAQLEGERLAAAVEYNRRRHHDAQTIETIQRVVGAEVDGVFGPETTLAVWRWQAELGFIRDGKVGPATLAAVSRNAAVQARGRAKLGVWVDDPPELVLSDQFFAGLAQLRLELVAVMLHRSTAGGGAMWAPSWTATQLGQLRERAEARAVEVVLTTWPLPSREQLKIFAAELPALLEASGAVALEVDAEGNWRQERLAGYADMDEASEALVQTLREAAAPSGARLELTTYPLHEENGAQARVAPHMDRLLPQAYSVATRRGKKIPWDGELGPGQIQTLSVERAMEIPGVAGGRPELGLGLAAFRQSFPGHTRAEAMQRALERARALGSIELRYWSSKWILGHMSKEETMRELFLELLGDEGSC